MKATELQKEQMKQYYLKRRERLKQNLSNQSGVGCNTFVCRDCLQPKKTLISEHCSKCGGLSIYKRPGMREKTSQAIKVGWTKPGARERQSIAIKKSHARPEVREKLSGLNCHLWRGGRPRNIASYGPRWARRLRDQIRHRDNYLCQNPGCYRPENGKHHHCHHIDFNKQNYDPANLISLCPNCHSKITSGRWNYWTTHFQAAQEMRGLINQNTGGVL